MAHLTFLHPTFFGITRNIFQASTNDILKVFETVGQWDEVFDGWEYSVSSLLPFLNVKDLTRSVIVAKNVLSAPKFLVDICDLGDAIQKFDISNSSTIKKIRSAIFSFNWDVFRVYKFLTSDLFSNNSSIIRLSKTWMKRLKVIGGVSFAAKSAESIADDIDNYRFPNGRHPISLKLCTVKVINNLAKFAIGCIITLKVFFIISVPAIAFLGLGTTILFTNIVKTVMKANHW